MYSELGHDSIALAELYLQASWTARDEAVGFYEGLKGPAETRALLDQGAKELDKDLIASVRKTVNFNLARVAHRGGYNSERDRYLEAFAAQTPHDDLEQEALTRFRTTIERIEPYYQDLAIASFEAGLRNAELDAPTRLRATYLMADLLRRRGKTAAALPLYKEVREHPETPENIKALATELHKQLRGNKNR